jgi:serine/threonine protein kinase/tetratricopeptide (TPR) repeat protein
VADGQGVALQPDQQQVNSMNPERWKQVKGLFQAVIEYEPDQRSAFLDKACDTDLSLRRQVEALIASDAQAEDFIETPLFNPADLLEDNRADSIVGRHVGFYKITREIGHGGMGMVYLAVRADDEYRKHVAIKLVKRGMDSDSIIKRFRYERQILAGLDHPNIARLIDGGTTDDGLPYFTMEYVEGTPITDYCDEHKLTTVERLKLFRTVCSAVHYAHQNLVVHRDIKPGNILITADGVPKLLDFGIAKLLNPELFAQTIDLTATALPLMTPQYASPEQVRGETITTASDVYSLGVVLYELLTGHDPYCFQSHLPSEIMQVVCEQEPPKPSTIISRIVEITDSDDLSRVMLTPESVSQTREGQPEKLRRSLVGDIDNIVLKSMRKEPQRRYASVEQFSEDIRRHLEGLPVIARKDTIGYRAEKFIKRHKAGVAAVALLVLTLAAGIIATMWQARVARAERARAERRFNDVRKLANSFVFELHDAIEKLPGSTPARELIVQRALGYLDSLAHESGNDPSLQLELANAYAKVGNIQWARYYANLGDMDGAFQSQRKALAIREAVVAADPANTQARASLAFSYVLMGDLYAGKGDLASALDNYRKSLNIREEIVKADPLNGAVRASLATSFQRIGDTLGNPGFPNLGDKQGALDNYRRMQAINESLVVTQNGDADARHRLAIGYEKLARIIAADGDLAGALELYRKELAGFKELADAYPTNTQYRRDLTIGYSNVGDSLAQLKNYEGALENYHLALLIREQIATADPRNAGAREDLADIQDLIASALAARKDTTGALESDRKALAIFEELYAADPNDRIIGSRLSQTLNSLASLTAKTGRMAEARNYSMRSLAIKRVAADGPAATANDLDDYARSLVTCEPADLRNPTLALSYAERALEMTKGNEANVLNTLALSYDLTGDHARAIETEEKALTISQKDSQQRDEFEANLARFKAALNGKKE